MTFLRCSHRFCPVIASGLRLPGKLSGSSTYAIYNFGKNIDAHTVWLRIYLMAEDLSRLNISHRRLLPKSGLVGTLREVQSDAPRQICLEQTDTQSCPNNYSADDLQHVVATVRPNLWMTVSSIPPYRRY